MTSCCLDSHSSSDMMEEETLIKLVHDLPKCELHLHLDGSLSPRFVCRRLVARGLALPGGVTEDGNGLRAYLHDMKSNHVICMDNRAEKNGNWGVFDFCNQVLQTEEELIEGVYDVLSQLHEENVRLCELRFCPNLHTLEGLSPYQVVWAVVRGFQRGAKEYGIIGGVILCGLRSFSTDVTMATAALCCQMSKETDGVVLGYDIAGDEGTFSIDDHLPSLRFAASKGVGVTCHAGEWPVNDIFGNGSLDNLRLVLRESELIQRVGHGIQLTLDPELMHHVTASQTDNGTSVCFECCMTSNVGWKVESYQVHPVKEMMRAGVRVSLSSDNLLLSGTIDKVASPNNELIHFVRDVGMTVDDITVVLMNGVHSSFTFTVQQWTEVMKEEWLSKFRNEMQRAIAKYCCSKDDIK